MKTMKKLSLAIASFCLAATAQEITRSDSTLVMDLSAKNWGSNSSYSTRVAEEKTPDGKPCLELTIPPGNNKTVMIIGNNAGLAAESRKFPEEWEELTFSYQSSDCSITLAFQTKGTDGQIIFSNCFLKPTGGKWKQVSLKKAMQWCSSKEGTKLNRLTAITFLAKNKEKTQKLRIGPLTFRKKTAPAPESI